MQGEGVGDGGIAGRQEGADFRTAQRPCLLHRAAVAAMDKPVAVAGLAAAFFLKDNPGLDFRTHSNRRNSQGVPPPASCFSTRTLYARVARRSAWI